MSKIKENIIMHYIFLIGKTTINKITKTKKQTKNKRVLRQIHSKVLHFLSLYDIIYHKKIYYGYKRFKTLK